MNVLSDFEIRLRKYFPDTAEQDQIYKLSNQVIERDMVIEKQVMEIDRLERKVSRLIPKVDSVTSSLAKSSIKEAGRGSRNKTVKGRKIKETDIVSSPDIKIKKKTPVKVSAVKKVVKPAKTKKETTVKRGKSATKNKKV
jgi:uncharacterized coiled-coil protein SlyX